MTLSSRTNGSPISAAAITPSSIGPGLLPWPSARRYQPTSCGTQRSPAVERHCRLRRGTAFAGIARPRDGTYTRARLGK